MKFKRFCKGANLVDYVIPTLVVGVVAGTAIYGLVESNTIRTNIMGSLSGQFEPTKGEISFGSSSQKTGMYQDANGDFYLVTKSGKNVSVPENLAQAVKDSILKHHDNVNSVGEETTGAFGTEAENTDVSSEFMTGQYSEILDTLAEECDTKTAKKLLKTLSDFADNLALAEGKLVDINAVMLEKKQDYELSEAEFHKNREDFIDTLKNNKYDNVDQLINKYNDYRDSYYNYRDDTKEYKKASNEYVKKATKAFDKIEKDTGVGYELLLFLVKANKNVPEEAKDLAVPIGEEIVTIKDDILVTSEKVDFLKSVLNDQDKKIESEVDEYFEALKIIIDDKETLAAYANDETASFSTPEETKDETEVTEEEKTEELLGELDDIIDKITVEVVNGEDTSITLDDTTTDLDTEEEQETEEVEEDSETELPEVTVDDLDENTIDSTEGQDIVDILTDMNVEDANSVEDATEQILDIVATEETEEEEETETDNGG